MEIGVSTHIHVYKPLDRELLSLLRDAGFEAVELYANKPHWSDYDSNAGQRRIAEFCIDLHLTINSIHTPFYRDFDAALAGRWLSVTSADQDVRRESVDRIIDCLGVAGHVPVECAVVHVGAAGEEENSGTFERLFYSLEDILPVAGELGIKIALENITNDFSRGHRIVQFLEQSGLNKVGCCYDCGHAALYGRTVEELGEMAPLLMTTHIHDTTGGQDNHKIPFQGDIDWSRLAEAFAASEYDGVLIIESKDDSGSPETLEAAAAAANRLRDMVLAERVRIAEQISDTRES